ncbi:hypothetical protein B0H10DRAFT_2190886 [Mycena sp. CBHHK59/15]|nr:hypothetical protein B0H10DRAFT_2190886 [Mycena sp. CBHHK59/15]
MVFVPRNNTPYSLVYCLNKPLPRSWGKRARIEVEKVSRRPDSPLTRRVTRDVTRQILRTLLDFGLYWCSIVSHRSIYEMRHFSFCLPPWRAATRKVNKKAPPAKTPAEAAADELRMKQALVAVLDSGLTPSGRPRFSLRAASKQYDVARTTLQGRYNGPRGCRSVNAGPGAGWLKKRYPPNAVARFDARDGTLTSRLARSAAISKSLPPYSSLVSCPLASVSSVSSPTTMRDLL